MIRSFTVLCIGLFGVAAWASYQLKNEVAGQKAELARLHQQLRESTRRTALLQADLTLVTRGDWVATLAQQHLALEPAQPHQTLRLQHIERRLPQAVAFAGAPPLFLPPGAAPTALAVAPRPAAGPVMASRQPEPPAPPRPAEPAAGARLPEAPAPQALAAVIAAQRATRPPAAPPPPPVRPVPIREAESPRPLPPGPAPTAVPAIRPAEPPRPAPAVTSVFAGSALGGVALAPPVPFSQAQAAPLRPAPAGTLRPPAP
jgi:hypothetical protein